MACCGQCRAGMVDPWHFVVGPGVLWWVQSCSHPCQQPWAGTGTPSASATASPCPCFSLPCHCSIAVPGGYQVCGPATGAGRVPVASSPLLALAQARCLPRQVPGCPMNLVLCSVSPCVSLSWPRDKVDLGGDAGGGRTGANLSPVTSLAWVVREVSDGHPAEVMPPSSGWVCWEAVPPVGHMSGER